MNETNKKEQSLSEKLPNYTQESDLNLIEIWFALLRRKKLVGFITILFFITSLFYSVYKRFSAPLYKGSFSIMIEDPLEGGRIQNNKANLSSLGNLITSSNNLESKNTLIYFLKSEAVLNPFIEKYDLEKFKLNIIQKKLDNKKEAKGVIEINALFKNRKNGKIILTNLSKYFVNIAAERRTNNLNEGINFLNSQIPNARDEQLYLQNLLAEFSSKNLIADPIYERTLVSKKKSLVIEEKENTLIEKTKLLKLRESFVKGENPNLLFTELYTSATPNNKSIYQPIFLLQESENELEIARKTFKPNSKIIRSLEARVVSLKKDALDSAIKLNQERLDALNVKINDSEKEFKILNEHVKEYEPIFKELKLVDKELLNLLELRNNLELNLAQAKEKWSIVDNPKITNYPVSPSFPKNLSLSIFFGLIVGSLVSLIRDKLDNVFHDVDEIKDSLKIPHLSHVPYVRIFENLRDKKSSVLETLNNDNLDQSNEETKNEQYERFFYQEAFRNLYTSIRFLDTDKNLKSIVLTSSLPAEGKSLINILFAKTLSDLGEKVLLIDADLRKPTLHTKLGINNLKGLSNLLTNKDLTPSKVIQKIPGNKNWSVLTAGIKPPDPTRLLSSKRLKDLITELENEFDLILFDTPPVSHMSDAILVSKSTSGIILLVTLFSTDRKIPLDSLNRIKSSNSPILGFVSNLQKDKVINNSTYNTYEAYADYVIEEEKLENLNENKEFSNFYEKIKLITKNIIEWIEK